MANISALQSALSGLLAQRQRLDVIGHNVANASTEGYSRQRVDMVSGGNGPVPALFSEGLVTGDGVDVTGVTRNRDQFLETRALGERSAEWSLDGLSGARLSDSGSLTTQEGLPNQGGKVMASVDGLHLAD